MQEDQALIRQFQEGKNKEASFTKLLYLHQESVYHQIRRMGLVHADADDIAQQVWIKVWNKLEGFKMESEFSTWLFRVVYNETLNFLQQQKRKNVLMTTSSEIVDDLSKMDTPMGSTIQIKLQQAVKQLPDKQRVVFVLRYFDAFSYEKIASIMDITVGGAKANFHQAVKKVEEYFQKN